MSINLKTKEEVEQILAEARRDIARLLATVMPLVFEPNIPVEARKMIVVAEKNLDKSIDLIGEAIALINGGLTHEHS